MSDTLAPIRELPLYESRCIDVLDVHGNRYEYRQGLSNEYAEQLKVYSQDLADEALQEATSDFQRFGVDGYEAWFQKKRSPFALIDPNLHKLAAIIWFGPKTLGRPSLKHLTPTERRLESEHSMGDWHTVSYRAYPMYRGKGLMGIFCARAIADYQRLHPTVRLWLSIDSYNETSFHIAEKLGFVRSQEYTDEARHHYVYIQKHG